jgi:hypothetical protein
MSAAGAAVGAVVGAAVGAVVGTVIVPPGVSLLPQADNESTSIADIMIVMIFFIY